MAPNTRDFISRSDDGENAILQAPISFDTELARMSFVQLKEVSKSSAALSSRYLYAS